MGKGDGGRTLRGQGGSEGTAKMARLAKEFGTTWYKLN